MCNQRMYHHKNLKNALIERGIELVSTGGRGAFSLRKVASECGVSHAAPYSHFRNADELLAAMQNHITDEFSRLLEHTARLYCGEPDILERFGCAYIEFFVDHPHYYAFLFNQSGIRIDLTSSADGSVSYLPFEIYRKIAIGVLEQNGFPVEKRSDALIALWAFVHGIASLATMQNVIYDENWKHKSRDFIRTISSLCKSEAGM